MRERERQAELRNRTGGEPEGEAGETSDGGDARQRAQRLRAQGQAAIDAALANDPMRFLAENRQQGGE